VSALPAQATGLDFGNGVVRAVPYAADGDEPVTNVHFVMDAMGRASKPPPATAVPNSSLLASVMAFPSPAPLRAIVCQSADCSPHLGVQPKETPQQ
jgi:hypothetical protein